MGSKVKTTDELTHSIVIDPALCSGCVICVKACPVQAIRIVNGKAEVRRNKLCIDCGECLRVCPAQAIKPFISSSKDMAKYKVRAALPSPVIYTQFGRHYTPNDILLAFRKIGFEYVYDVAFSCEQVIAVIGEYLKMNTKIRPMISNYCPSVVRLISKSYPELIPNIIPIDAPREIAALKIREKIVKEKKVKPEEVGIFHITPCAAKMISIMHPVALEKSNLDGAIGFRDVFTQLLQALKEENDDDLILQKSSGIGISWAIGKAGTRGLPSFSSLTVNGVRDTIQILDDIESGRLQDVDYLDCAICPGGCVAGPLVVQNKHVATSIAEELIEQYGVKSRIDVRKVLREYNEVYFFENADVKPETPEPLDSDFAKAIEKMNRIEELRELLPGIQCAACGAPTCRAFAEDIVRGEADINDCVFMKIKELENELNSQKTDPDA